MKRLCALLIAMTLFLCSLPGAFAASAEEYNASKTIVVDAGHGGYDGGAVYEGICEKDINLAVAKRLESILKDKGYRVIMTRSTDKFVKLRTRAAIANNAGADLFVSIHANAAKNAPYYTGIYTYRCPGSSNGYRLAKAVQMQICSQTGGIDRGVMSEYFTVLYATKMPAVLVELGFMSNHSELQNLIAPAYQDKLAEGIAQGISDYLGK